MLIALLVIELLVVVVGPAAVASWVHRRRSGSWRAFGWGMLAFVAAQLLRLPLLVALTAAARGWQPDEEVAFWFNLVVLCLSAGLFEEGARFVLLRWAAPTLRAARDGVMFGLGHGGIEAALLVGLAVVNTLVLLVFGDTILEQVTAQAPDALPQIQQQLERVRGIHWWEPLLATWERGVAVSLHVALTLIVLRSVTTGRLAVWGLAVVLHAAVNAAALVAMRYGGLPAASVAVTATALVPLALAVRWWRPEPLTPTG